MSVPNVSIVVTVRNAGDSIQSLLDCFDALQWPKDRLEIIIVDAFSDDGTWEWLQQWRQETPQHVVLSQQSGGISAGRNAAFALAKGEFVAVTDADMRVPVDWIEQLMVGMEQGVGVVGGPNDDASDRWLNRASNAIPMHGPSKGEIPIFGQSRYSYDFTTQDDHFAAVTRNCMFRRAAFDAAGGFDENLITAEDGELNRRIMAAGYVIRYRRAAGVLHEHRPSVRGFWRQQRNYARGQAQANRKDAAMARARHRLPAIALLVFLTTFLIAAIYPAFWTLPATLAGVALTVAVLYGVKAAVFHRRPGMVLPVAFLFIVWMLAWAIGYPEGAWRRGLARGSHQAD